MKKQIKRYFVSVIIVLFICNFCATFSNAYVAANWRECANAPGCSCTIKTIQTTSSPMKTYIVESAGYFLNSHSAYQAFLNRVELADTNEVDFNDLREILDRAIDNMEKAKGSYTNLKTVSEKTPYNQVMIDQLMKFDYDSFRIKYGLVESIFEKLKILLCKGNISGFDNAVLDNMYTILNKLYEVKAAVDIDHFPEIALLWRANQAYVEAQLFAQYMSEVFRDILF